MKYKYTGYDRAAQKISGEIEATTEGEARLKLRSLSVRPISLVGEGAAGNVVSKGPGGVNIDLGVLFKKFQAGSAKPDLFQLTAFIRQFATMQGAGIPIVQALGNLAAQSENKAFGLVLADIQKQIQEGTNFTDALKKHGKIFDRLFINLIAAGEVSGSLDKVLLRLAVYYEKAAALRRKIISASTYPIIVVALVIVIVLVMLYFVVPTFAEMFSSNGQALPQSTLIVLGISKWMQQNWYFVIGGLASFVGGLVFVFKNDEIREKLDPILLKLPLFGDLIQKVAVARFSRTLATMIQSGVPLLDALEITARVSGNSVIEKAILKTKESITQGSSIAEPLIRAKIFPQMVTSMVAVGEQTGSIDQMLTKVAEFYEDEVDNKVSAMTSILEPILIVIVGLVVVSILIPMYMPIFTMSEAMTNKAGG